MSWQDFSKLRSSQGKVVTKRKHHHPAEQQQQASLLVQQKPTYIWAMDTRIIIIIIIGVVINIIAMNVKCHYNYRHHCQSGEQLLV